MKKLILSLFLVLVASSHAMPNFVNSKRAEEKGYKVVQEGQYQFKKLTMRVQQLFLIGMG